MTGTLITAIVPRGDGMTLISKAKQSGLTGGTILEGRGTAQNQLLQMLGLGDIQKDIILIVENSGNTQQIIDVLVSSVPSDKKHYGILFTADLLSILKNGKIILSEGENSMQDQSSHELITIIVNSGNADDVMAAARKAGASGGTVISGRGTGKAGDVLFFGLTLVPEKEIIIIIADKAQTPVILQAVKDIDCVSAPCSGISFCIPVTNVTHLQ